MTVALDLATDALATWRLTHLIVEDVFPPVAKAREAVIDRYGPDSSLSYLVSCVFCTGVWVAGGVAAARLLAPRRWGPASRMLAIAAAAPLVEAALNRLEASGGS